MSSKVNSGFIAKLRPDLDEKVPTVNKYTRVHIKGQEEWVME